MAIYFGLTPAQKLVIADAYYASGNHISSLDWLNYSENDRTAGIIQAEREIDAWFGISLEQSFDETSFPIDGLPNYRPDYAVFEHAFFILDNTARTKTESDGPEMIESEDYQQEEKNHGLNMAPMALTLMKIATNRVEFG